MEFYNRIDMYKSDSRESGSCLEYHYYVLPDDFGVDIPHQIEVKAVSFSRERDLNIMNKLIKEVHQYYWFCVSWINAFQFFISCLQTTVIHEYSH